MTYEINTITTRKNGKVITMNCLATEYEMATKDGLNAIKALPENKSRYKWFEIPNDYQMNTYFQSFELTISEATTGKNIYKVTK